MTNPHDSLAFDTAAVDPSTAARNRRWVSPLVVWACVGVVALLLQTWILGRWIIDGGLRPGDTTDYAISPARAAVIWGFHILLAAILGILTIAFVRECRRTRAITVNAAMFLGWFLVFWQNPLLNYQRWNYWQSRSAPNVTSWGPYFPGWNPPHAELAIESVLVAGIFAYPMMWLWPALQGWITDRIAIWRPRWGLPRLMTASFLAACVVDIGLEGVWLQTGVYMYPDNGGYPTLFTGHWYQLPMLVTLVIAVTIGTPVVLMRQYAKKHGTTVHIFRGSHLFGTRPQAWLRLSAGIGFLNVLMFAAVVAFVLIGYLGHAPMPADTPTQFWPLPSSQ